MYYLFTCARGGISPHTPSLLLPLPLDKLYCRLYWTIGIWPESQSFNDHDMGPIPSNWKGECENGKSFNASHCNRKIIGARYFSDAYEAENGPLDESRDSRSARDLVGHGTSMASIVTGGVVHNTSALGGFAKGTASGGATMARLGIYKACWHSDPGNAICADADLMKAIDKAISDGVDMLSIAVSWDGSIPYNEDGIAIASLHAIKNNILTVCAAGNFGPDMGSVDNTAPWIATVGASTIDRNFPSPIRLGNGITIKGESVTPYTLSGQFPLAYAADLVVDGLADDYPPFLCYPNSLSPNKTEGKIVFCHRGGDLNIANKSMEVRNAGGVGIITGNRPPGGDCIEMETLFLPGTLVNADNSLQIIEYMKSGVTTTAALTPGETVLGNQTAPSICIYSSRGPNRFDPNVLKPDMIGPGVNILAAWSPAGTVTGLDGDNRSVHRNFVTGTSVATAHVTATAILIKAMHPTWSPSAIKSALITTATDTNNMGEIITDHLKQPGTPFDFGGGHIRPAKAASPGLVYETSYQDYVLHLCSIGFAMEESLNCTNQAQVYDLNYPSLAIPNINGEVKVNRTVTNVGEPRSMYQSSVVEPQGFSVDIYPSILSFEDVGEKKSFTITVKENGTSSQSGEYAFGSYLWTYKTYVVKSSIAVSRS